MMEPPKMVGRSRIIAATTENYQELISSPGNTLVMYDIWEECFGNDRRIRQAVRGIARDYPPGQLSVVLVDISHCKTGADKIAAIPTFRLFRDGQERLPLLTRHHDGEWVREWLAELIGPPPAKEGDIQRVHKCDLPNGIELLVRNTSKQLSVRDVADSLAKAMEYFKHQRDTLKTGIYQGGPYTDEIKMRRRILGTIRLWCPNNEELTAASWTEAVIEAYTNANSVEQMLDELPVWQKAVEKEGGYLRDVVGMLDKPGGDLLAMAAMIDHSLKRKR